MLLLGDANLNNRSNNKNNNNVRHCGSRSFFPIHVCSGSNFQHPRERETDHATTNSHFIRCHAIILLMPHFSCIQELMPPSWIFMVRLLMHRYFYLKYASICWLGALEFYLLSVLLKTHPHCSDVCEFNAIYSSSFRSRNLNGVFSIVNNIIASLPQNNFWFYEGPHYPMTERMNLENGTGSEHLPINYFTKLFYRLIFINKSHLTDYFFFLSYLEKG